jgi:hypothetical protein
MDRENDSASNIKDYINGNHESCYENQEHNDIVNKLEKELSKNIEISDNEEKVKLTDFILPK